MTSAAEAMAEGFHRSLLRYAGEAARPHAKRQRGCADELTWIDGDDAAMSVSDEEQRWRQIVATCPHSWCDEEFPATQLSIDGREEMDPSQAAPTRGAAPRCRCGVDAQRSIVASDTQNKGRPYLHCARRFCGFFAWADGGQSGKRRYGPLGWQRFPHLLVVSDYGFRATDLRQGGVGDCWCPHTQTSPCHMLPIHLRSHLTRAFVARRRFMSALAVVAERHDLIARLFAETAVNSAGCYCLRFFLDGEW